MSSESVDGEQSNDWTLINAGEEDEGQITAVEQENREENIEERKEISIAEHECQNVITDNLQLASKISEIPNLAVEKSVEVVLTEESSEASPDANLKDGSDTSDIERISDDGMEVYNMEASVLSQASSFSIVTAPAQGLEADVESLASSSSISVIQDDENGDLSTFSCSKDEMPDDLDATRVRSYTHTPNARLNFALNLLLALSVTMVVGLGIGHFIGWSSRWIHQNHLQHTHVTKLKALQEELVNCLQNPESYYVEGNGESKACYEKVDYWQEKFNDILSQNHVLQSFIDRSTLEDVDDDNDEKCEEANQNIITEYRQLKFHLISQQLQNVATLRRMEALKRQEQETLDRVKQLEEENEELKAQVEEDERDNDGTSDEDVDKEIIKQLSDENKELKGELNQLMAALKMEQEEDDKKSVEELGCLREQINQLKIANSELQQVIAKLRYGQPPLEEPVPEERNPANEKDETENQKDDSVLHSWLVDNMKDVNLTGFMEYLIKVARDKDAARKVLEQLQENLKSSYEQLSEKAKLGIDTGKTILADIQKSFQSKLQQIMKVNASNSALSIESIQKIGKTLKNTVEKLYAIGADVLSTDSSDPINNNENKFRKQVDKLLTNFGKQWESIKTKMWGEKSNNKVGDGQKKETQKFGSNNDVEKKPVSAEQKMTPKRTQNGKPLKQTSNENGNSANRHEKENKINSKKKAGQKKKISNLKMKEHAPDGKKGHTTDIPQIKSKKMSDDKDAKKDSKKFKNHQYSYESDKVNEKTPINTKSDKENNFDKKRLKEFKQNKKLKNLDQKQKQSNPKHSKPTSETPEKNRNHSGTPIENSGDWVYKRADERANERKNKQQSDWLFERAHNREKTRKESEKSEWYFNRVNRHENKQEYEYTRKAQSKSKNYRKWGDDDDDDDTSSGHDEEQEIRQKRLKKKKTYKKVDDHKQWSSDEESDDEDRDSCKRNRYQRYSYHHHSYNYDWAVPDPSYTAAYFY